MRIVSGWKDGWLLGVLLLICLVLKGTVAQENATEVSTEPGVIETDAEEGETDVDEPDDVDEEVDEGLLSNFTPTEAPTIPTIPPTSEDGCHTNLRSVYVAISDDDKLFEPKRFVICPGTVVNLGFLVPGVGIDNGDPPFVPRSNSEFLCGEDGNVENNCIIRGGDFGLLSVPVFFRQDLSVNNVLIKGFTFEGQIQYAGFMAVPGDIVMEDCIFREMANFGPLVINHDSTLQLSGRRLLVGDDDDAEEVFDNPWDAAHDYIQRYRDGSLPRRLKEVMIESSVPQSLSVQKEAIDGNDEDRDLQQEQILDMVLKNCEFTNLQQVERKLGVEFGVVTVKTKDNKLRMYDTTFSNCQYGNQELTPIGYAVLLQDAAFVMDGVCFVNNDFRGSGVVVLETTPNPFGPNAGEFIANNYVTEDDNDLDCPFAAYFATDDDRKDYNFTCVPPQATECGAASEPDEGGEEATMSSNGDSSSTNGDSASTNGGTGEEASSSSDASDIVFCLSRFVHFGLATLILIKLSV